MKRYLKVFAIQTYLKLCMSPRVCGHLWPSDFN